MTWTNSQAAGENQATTVNLTPPLNAPVAYSNTAERSAALPNVSNIQVGGGPIHNLATQAPQSSGDSGGSNGGVVSGTVSGMSVNLSGSNSVLVKGMPATRMTDPTLQNDKNTVGTGASPSQRVVMNLAP